MYINDRKINMIFVTSIKHAGLYSSLRIKYAKFQIVKTMTYLIYLRFKLFIKSTNLVRKKMLIYSVLRFICDIKNFAY